MTALASVKRINASRVISVTPTISTSAYTSGDQIGGIMTISDAVRFDTTINKGFSEIVSVTILDSSKQDVAIDIWFFHTSPTVTSTDNAPFAMTAANMNAQAIGVVQVGLSGTYSDAAAVSICSTCNLNLPAEISSASTAIYAIAVVRGTPTYATTSSLQFKFGLFLD